MNCCFCKIEVHSPVHCIGCTTAIYCSAYCQHCAWESDHYKKCTQNLHPIHAKTGFLRATIPTIELSNYERVPLNGNDVLGNGAFGKVVRVRNIATGVLYAMKIIGKSNAVKHHVLTAIQAEIEVQSKLFHENIIGYVGWAEDMENIYSVMELAEGSLYRYLIKDIRTEEQIRDVFQQICRGLYFIHLNGYIHRDIKPENILMREGCAKISDFGCCTTVNSKKMRSCGTLEYIAPEVYENKGSINFQVDIYSLGVLLYELYHKHTPYKGKHEKETISIITSKVQPKFSPFISTSLMDLILKLLDKNPAKRLTWNQIFTHPWIMGKDQSSCRKIGEVPCMLKRKILIDDDIDEEEDSKFLSTHNKICQPLYNHSSVLKNRHESSYNSTSSDYSNHGLSSFQNIFQSALYK